ncbi:hypothetical protein O6H91_12G044000 [Diphasiastrum complanatum]|uniref:Uncharacterized protein n=1 Tax=Diphasiastrum complanatum TaxID=34168 RepID=A0ACC2C119_DIPCM|nr:hypothetical protein O6H91_12G044000 [Diphasiastrum complanatum]
MNLKLLEALTFVQQLQLPNWRDHPFRKTIQQDPHHPFNPASNDLQSGCAIQQFAPYSCRIPWHTGMRAYLSKLFPKYGNYCGPNWSSGRDGGSLRWDKPPVDGLDYCCYLHDIGYDTHNQMDLYKADLALLHCLLQARTCTYPAFQSNHKQETFVAAAYRSACIFGLRTFLIPYRKFLLQQRQLPRIIQGKAVDISGRL